MPPCPNVQAWPEASLAPAEERGDTWPCAQLIKSASQQAWVLGTEVCVGGEDDLDPQPRSAQR